MPVTEHHAHYVNHWTSHTLCQSLNVKDTISITEHHAHHINHRTSRTLCQSLNITHTVSIIEHYAQYIKQAVTNTDHQLYCISHWTSSSPYQAVCPMHWTSGTLYHSVVPCTENQAHYTKQFVPRTNIKHTMPSSLYHALNIKHITPSAEHPAACLQQSVSNMQQLISSSLRSRTCRTWRRVQMGEASTRHYLIQFPRNAFLCTLNNSSNYQVTLISPPQPGETTPEEQKVSPLNYPYRWSVCTPGSIFVRSFMGLIWLWLNKMVVVCLRA